MRVMFAGGGTGGHIYPALAVAEEIMVRLPETEILFIAGTREIENKIISNAGYPMKSIPVIGLPRKLTPVFIPFAWKLLQSIFKSRNYMRGFKPSVVMASGGYVASPPIMAARTLGVPVVILEQNSYPGITNKKLCRFADIVFLGFSDTAKYFRGKAKTIVTGNPIRRDIGSADRETSSVKFGFIPEKKTVMVCGGSQGSRAINNTFSTVVKSLADRDIQVLWQTGNRDYNIWKSFEDPYKGKIKIFPFIDNMAAAYGASDIVIARAGAITTAELTKCGLPAVFVPLPTAAEHHQEHNARALANAGAAIMILEQDLTPQLLEKELLAILLSEERLSAMSEASRELGKGDAAGLIAGMIIERYSSN